MLSVLAILIGVASLALLVNVSRGEYPVPLGAVVKTILGLPTTSDYAFLVNPLRLPWALSPLLVGMGLATAGTILQGLTHNPLAAPGIIGINSEASLVAVAFIVLWLAWLPLAAFTGTLLAAIAIHLLAWNQGSSSVRLILVGVGLTALTGSGTTLMITFGNIYDVSQALVWLTGSVYGCSWANFWPLLPWLLLFMPLALVLARDFAALALGDDLAQGLGDQLEWICSLLLCLYRRAGGLSDRDCGHHWLRGIDRLTFSHTSRRPLPRRVDSRCGFDWRLYGRAG